MRHTEHKHPNVNSAVLAHDCHRSIDSVLQVAGTGTGFMQLNNIYISVSEGKITPTDLGAGSQE